MSTGSAAQTNPRYLSGVTAGVTQASNQFKAVKWASTANAVIAVAATTDVAIGIIQDNPVAAAAALVQNGGDAVGLAGTSNIAAGNNLGYNTTGQLVPHTTDNRMSLGRARTSSSAIGDYVVISLYDGGSQRY